MTLKKYTVKAKKKTNYLSIQCHLDVLDRLSNGHKNICIHIHHSTHKRNKRLKTSR